MWDNRRVIEEGSFANKDHFVDDIIVWLESYKGQGVKIDFMSSAFAIFKEMKDSERIQYDIDHMKKTIEHLEDQKQKYLESEKEQS